MMRLPVCAGLLCTLLGAASPLPAEDFLRGDVNGDGVVSISDAHYLKAYLFLGSAEPRCHNAADADDNGLLQISDARRLLEAEFRDGPPPAAPFPAPGPDPTNPEVPGCQSSGTGSPYEDPAARLELLDITAFGGDDQKVVLTLAISSSVEIAGYSGRIRDEAGVLDLEEGSAVERRELTEFKAENGGFIETRIVDGMIEYGVLFTLKPIKLVQEPGEGVSVLELGVCLKPGTPAGEYALSVVDGELIASNEDHDGQAINPILQGGTLTVTSDVEAAAGCDPRLFPPPPPINIAFKLDEGTGNRGGDVTIPFSILADRASQGFTYSIHFDEAILQATGTDKLFLGGDGSPYEFEKFEINNDTGFLVGAAITSLTD
ncbi:MAG TPA: dockerin type I domain-containing protein, partial [Planctomycetota bacterium]|nr:dockerin type I domain-containing protein [Planctomycetota bacterium]